MKLFICIVYFYQMDILHFVEYGLRETLFQKYLHQFILKYEVGSVIMTKKIFFTLAYYTFNSWRFPAC